MGCRQSSCSKEHGIGQHGHVVHTTGVKITEDDGFKKYNQFTVIRKLGSGSFGTVKLCMDNDGNYFAMKKVPLSLYRSHSIRDVEAVEKEVTVLADLDSPYIVKLYEVIDDPDRNKTYLILEYMRNGPVLHVKDDGFTDPPAITDEILLRRHFHDLLEAVDYLHKQHVLHFDIKPENLLKAADGTLKLSDFGVSQLLPPGTGSTIALIAQTTYGTPAFSPPECFHGSLTHIPSPLARDLSLASASFISGSGPPSRKLTREQMMNGVKADIWAMGVTLYCLACGHLPFLPRSCIRAHERDEVILLQESSVAAGDIPPSPTSPKSNGSPEKSSSISPMSHKSASSVSKDSPSPAKGDRTSLRVEVQPVKSGVSCGLQSPASPTRDANGALVDDYRTLSHAIRINEPEYPDYLSPGLKHLLKRMLDKSPSKRATIRELKRHPWLLGEEMEAEDAAKVDDDNTSVSGSSGSRHYSDVPILLDTETSASTSMDLGVPDLPILDAETEKAEEEDDDVSALARATESALRIGNPKTMKLGQRTIEKMKERLEAARETLRRSRSSDVVQKQEVET